MSHADFDVLVLLPVLHEGEGNAFAAGADCGVGGRTCERDCRTTFANLAATVLAGHGVARLDGALFDRNAIVDNRTCIGGTDCRRRGVVEREATTQTTNINIGDITRGELIETDSGNNPEVTFRNCINKREKVNESTKEFN